MTDVNLNREDLRRPNSIIPIIIMAVEPDSSIKIEKGILETSVEFISALNDIFSNLVVPTLTKDLEFSVARVDRETMSIVFDGIDSKQYETICNTAPKIISLFGTNGCPVFSMTIDADRTGNVMGIIHSMILSRYEGEDGNVELEFTLLDQGTPHMKDEFVYGDPIMINNKKSYTKSVKIKSGVIKE